MIQEVSMAMATVLVVDDDRKLTEMLRRTLAYEGYQVVTAADGRQALNEVRRQVPDAIILDWMLPELDGIAVAKHLSAGGAPPILMLTARDAIEDRVQGLESGVEDYLVKPFAPPELLARLRLMLRREHHQRQRVTGQRLAYGELWLDTRTHETGRGARRFDLTATEFSLLHYLMQNPQQVLSREQLLEHVWGYDFEGNTSIVDVYIGYLRTKTEAGTEPRLIQTVRGIGFLLRAE
jgi:two-component system, OmpR family, response regulator MprA